MPHTGIVCLFYLKINYLCPFQNLKLQVQRGYTTGMSTDKHYRKKLGAWGETLASDYLSKKGYELLEKNYHTRYGEIDLIMKIGGQLVAVEVKTRKSSTFGIAEDSITRKKYEAIQSTMFVYLESHPELGTEWQLDILVIETDLPGKTQIIHYENVYLDYLNG